MFSSQSEQQPKKGLEKHFGRSYHRKGESKLNHRALDELLRIYTQINHSGGFIMSRFIRLATATAVALSAVSSAAFAGDCTGYVVGVRPLSQYNHANGNGFLAVRTGPGSKFQQIGELYLGDEFVVAERRGNWVLVGCMSGQCESPLWGTSYPEGWAYRKYLDYGGVCP
jgi:hypothetical protein